MQWDLVREFLTRIMLGRTWQTVNKIDYYIPLILDHILRAPEAAPHTLRMRRRNNCMASLLTLCFPPEHQIWQYVTLY